MSFNSTTVGDEQCVNSRSSISTKSPRINGTRQAIQLFRIRSVRKVLIVLLSLAIVTFGFSISKVARAEGLQNDPTFFHSAIISSTPNLVVGSSTSNGFTMHFSIDPYGTTKVGWTVQPHTVAAMDNWMRANAVTVAAGKAAMAVAGAYICGILLTGFGAALCGAIFAVWLGFMVDTFHNAHTLGVCVTIKVYVPLFKIFDEKRPLWNGFPYADAGSWCNRKVYITPPPPPNPQGPRMPSNVYDPQRCSVNPNDPVCL
jgi:hypothetical protein